MKLIIKIIFIQANLFRIHILLSTKDLLLTRTDDVIAYWSSLVSSIIDKYAPIKSVRVSERYCPWINANLKTLMHSRNKTKRVAIKNRSPLLMSIFL